jgi:hypothetical protein
MSRNKYHSRVSGMGKWPDSSSDKEIWVSCICVLIAAVVIVGIFGYSLYDTFSVDHGSYMIVSGNFSKVQLTRSIWLGESDVVTAYSNGSFSILGTHSLLDYQFNLYIICPSYYSTTRISVKTGNLETYKFDNVTVQIYLNQT